jgi:hypothetical protein
MDLAPDAKTRAFYQDAMGVIENAGVAFMIGGAYAMERYTGIARHTKDLDIFVRPCDCLDALAALSRGRYYCELVHPHWLGKAYLEDAFVDVIYRSGNGIAEVDDEWFEFAKPETVLGRSVKICAPEEIIWSKSYVMERERYDGADIAHLLHACAEDLNWPRLLARFGTHWRIVFSHLLLFGFVYPSERSRVPQWVLELLIDRLREEDAQESENVRLCQGTLLSRAQYLVDLDQWGYEDARLTPRGRMTREQIAHWTAAIAVDGER